MPRYILKHYNRQNPGNTTGTMVTEWAIEAADEVGAIFAAEAQIRNADFRLPDDFAVLWDETGHTIWERVAHA